MTDPSVPHPDLRARLPGGAEQLVVSSESIATVGRGENCTVQISGPKVSREHARVQFHEGTWWFVDCSSTGTFTPEGNPVTNVQISSTPVQLRLGDPDGPTIELTSTDGQSVDEGTECTVLIGRGSECDIQLDGLLASRHHARLVQVGQSWVLNDLDSSNGTRVNGELTEERTLIDGDRVSIGGSIFRFFQGELHPVIGDEVSGFAATRLSVEIPDGPRILSDVTVIGDRGTFTAIVGPSGAGKSTLLKSLTGVRPPTGGTVSILGADLYKNYAELLTQLGYVPQDDIVHSQLTVQEALDFGSSLRFPESTDRSDRLGKVTEVLSSLGLLEHREKRVSDLSGGQRKRVSVALELLTEPDVLFLDEPTSGLDPAYERSLMELLRRLADKGRTVAVVTHSLASVYLCDQVVFLGTGGWVGFVGKPEDAIEHFAVDDYPGVFAALESDPPPTSEPLVEQAQHRASPHVIAAHSSYQNSFMHELRIQVLRQWAVLRSDPKGLLTIAATALIPSVLIALMVGSGALSEGSSNVQDGRMLLGAIAVTVCVIGAANGVREVVKELPIYLRERSSGLRKSSYLASKFVFRGIITAAQALLVVLVATSRTGGPLWGNILPAKLEIWIAVTAAGLATLALGFLISSLVSSSEKAMAAVPVLFVLLWLFSGSSMDLSDKPVLREVALLSPSNWAMSASASTADILRLEGCATQSSQTSDQSQTGSPIGCDARWTHGVVQWTFNMIVLLVFPIGLLALSEMALARKEPVPELRGHHIIGTVARKAADRIRNR